MVFRPSGRLPFVNPDVPAKETATAGRRNAPGLLIELVVINRSGEMLLKAHRQLSGNQVWTVIGTDIQIGESLDHAFKQLCLEMLGLPNKKLTEAEFIGVYERFHSDDMTDAVVSDVHCVVLAYLLKIDSTAVNLPIVSDDRYRWASIRDVGTDEDVHWNSRRYAIDLSADNRYRLPYANASLLAAIRTELMAARPKSDAERSAAEFLDGVINVTWLRWLTQATILLLLLALFVGGTHPAAGSLFAPPWDKVAHTSMYFSLYLLIQVGFSGRSWRIALLVISIGAADEVHQIALPHRHAGLDDLAADGFGVLLGLICRRALFVKR